MQQLFLHKVYYWLSLAGMTAKRANALLSVYSAMEIWDRVGKDQKLKSALGDKYYDALLSRKNIDQIDKELALITHKNIRVLTLAHDDYPEALRQKEVSPPLILYYKGDLSVLKKPCVAIVGTRAASRYGKETAEKFARDLTAAGVTVVSGMATGIDQFSHQAALECGTTVAVLGGGFDHVSPYSLSVFKKITEKNLVITEYPPSYVPTTYSFPERNRIISGLSRGVIVIEAGEKSGALYTAEYALEQGREVYALPGNITSSKSIGCNNLIKSGAAACITSALDVLNDLNIKTSQKKSKISFISLDIDEEKIYTLLESGETHLDTLIKESGFTTSQITAILFNMELKGLIKKLAGNCYALC